jgi:hypothetical protein
LDAAADGISEYTVRVTVIVGAGLCTSWRVEGARTTCVESHIILRDVIEPFNDVYLPIWTLAIPHRPAILSLIISAHNKNIWIRTRQAKCRNHYPEYERSLQ